MQHKISQTLRCKREQQYVCCVFLKLFNVSVYFMSLCRLLWTRQTIKKHITIMDFCSIVSFVLLGLQHKVLLTSPSINKIRSGPNPIYYLSPLAINSKKNCIQHVLQLSGLQSDPEMHFKINYSTDAVSFLVNHD